MIHLKIDKKTGNSSRILGPDKDVESFCAFEHCRCGICCAAFNIAEIKDKRQFATCGRMSIDTWNLGEIIQDVILEDIDVDADLEETEDES